LDFDPLSFSRALPSETREILAAYQALALGLQMRGIDQWEHYLGPAGEDLVERRFREGEVYWMRLQGRKAGFICLGLDEADWPGLGQDPNALFVLSLGVLKPFAGRGLGAGALDWAVDQALARGRSRLRLDCLADNPGLCAYYETHGFERIAGQERLGRALNLYERRLA